MSSESQYPEIAALIEELVMTRRMLSVRDQIINVLLVRLGGEATITREELHHTRSTYKESENLKAEDGELAEIHLRMRLK